MSIYERGGPLGHVTKIIQRNFCSPDQWMPQLKSVFRLAKMKNGKTPERVLIYNNPIALRKAKIIYILVILSYRFKFPSFNYTKLDKHIEDSIVTSLFHCGEPYKVYTGFFSKI